MTRTSLFKSAISFGLTSLLFASWLAGCKAPQNDSSNVTQTPANSSTLKSTLPPLRQTLACLPREAAMIAAHRGTDKRWRNKAENSIGALNALINHGTLMAEIDVAGLRDGTLITFQDGVWNDISTGKGPIARSKKSDLQNILLKSRKGKLTNDRPPEFRQMLYKAKGKIYLEVDFRSSANPRSVIAAIRRAEMTEHVLLIANTPVRAKLLDRIAPDMLRSNPPEASQTGHAVWMGYDVANGGGRKAENYSKRGIFTLGRIGHSNRQTAFPKLATAADILVTDQAGLYYGVEGLSQKERATFETCLRSKHG